MPASTLRPMVMALIKTGGGLSVDGQGRIYFDANSMDKSVFEEMMAKLRLPLWLDANMDFYVSAAADGDAIVDGRGTQTKPFKSLQACLDYALTNYNLNKHNLTINVAAGNYYGGTRAEKITVGSFQATTGKLTIKGAGRDSVKLPPIEINSSGQGVYLTSLTIGSYPDISAQDHSLWVRGSNAYLLDVAFDHSNMATEATGLYNLMCAEKSSLIELLPSNVSGMQGIYFKNANPGNRKLTSVMRAFDNSKISIYCDLNILYDLDCVEFALAENYSSVYGERRTWVAYPSVDPKANLNGHTVTGRRFVAKVFSNIDVRYGTEWLPGSQAGKLESGSINTGADS